MTFRYSKIKTSLVPKGWTNDPKKLRAVSANFAHESFGLEDPTPSPLLASTIDDGDPRCLLCWSARFYIWHVKSGKLFYVTDLYDLRGVSRRMSAKLLELRVKELQCLPAERFAASHEFLLLSFDVVPRGWYNSLRDLDDLRQKVPAQEYGLSLPLPILRFGGSSLGLAYQLFQSGERYYIYNQISFEILRINKPMMLQDILQVLDDTSRIALQGLSLERMEPLPEYGGRNKIPDGDVPQNWTNQVDSRTIGYIMCRGYGLGPCLNTLLYSESYLDGTPAYLFESQPSFRSSTYLWKPSVNEVYRIDGTDGLPDILATLNDAPLNLKLTFLRPLPGREYYRIADDDLPFDWRRVSNPDVCQTLPLEKHGLASPVPILQSIDSTAGRARLIFQSGGDFYLGHLHTKCIYRVMAAMGLDTIIGILKDPSRSLTLMRTDGPRNLLQ